MFIVTSVMKKCEDLLLRLRIEVLLNDIVFVLLVFIEERKQILVIM